ncbi:putative porin [Pseudomonas aeruginosa]|nr:putative porin [Pseudomonas aeruginosa]
MGCRAAQRLQAAGGRQPRAQPGLRRGRHAQARRRCGADRQQPRLRRRHQERANAWMLQFTLGNALDMRDAGDWQVFAACKYIQPDALPDGFNDSTFHLGGTNAKGYILGASYGFDKRVYGTARWLSSDEVYGAPFSIDVLQLEVNTRF